MIDTPLIPTQDLTVYAVLEDFGKHGAAWREIDELRADQQSIIEGILRGEYERVLRVVAFNADEGWARENGLAKFLRIFKRRFGYTGSE